MPWLFIINALLIFIIGVITLGVVCLFVYAYWVRGQTLINRWVDFNSYQYHLIQREWRWLRRGPFVFNPPWHVVYRVELLDRYDQKRVGWVLCGDGRLGAFNDEIIFTWHGSLSEATEAESMKRKRGRKPSHPL